MYRLALGSDNHTTALKTISFIDYEHTHLEKKEILLQYFTCINDNFYYQTGSCCGCIFQELTPEIKVTASG